MLNLAQQALLRLPPEVAHDAAMTLLRCYGEIPMRCAPMPSGLERTVMGIRFPSPVGLAAGLDKDGRAFRGLFKLGFGFIEIGTVTPRAQPGNPKPRMFRLRASHAIINRMGFNNAGVEALAQQVRRKPVSGVLGINLGKNKDTPDDRALDDYLYGLDRVYDIADYVAINISSPNTPGLRDLQFGEALDRLLQGLKTRQVALADQYGRYTPLVVKLAPDMSDAEASAIGVRIREAGIDGIIATNTTVSRLAVSGQPHAEEVGGLSGPPVRQRATEVIRCLRRALGPDYPIIGVGGIETAIDALEKLEAGADLLQIYTGFIYRGPALIREIHDRLVDA